MAISLNENEGTPDVKGGRGSESVREWRCKSNHEKIVPARLLYIKEEEIGKVIIKHKNELKIYHIKKLYNYHIKNKIYYYYEKKNYDIKLDELNTDATQVLVLYENNLLKSSLFVNGSYARLNKNNLVFDKSINVNYFNNRE